MPKVPSCPQYTYVELPVVPADTRVYFDVNELQAHPAQSDQITRACEISAPREFGKVHEIVEQTDEELKLVANACKSLVVPHNWALYKLPENKRAAYDSYSWIDRRRLGLPKHHILVATVDLITDIREPDITCASEIISGIKIYNQLDKPYMLGDLVLRQFKLGSDAQSSNATPQPYLLDIEPRWGHRPPNIPATGVQL